MNMISGPLPASEGGPRPSDDDPSMPGPVPVFASSKALLWFPEDAQLEAMAMIGASVSASNEAYVTRDN